jgi:GTP-binding protein LepA
MSYEFIKYKQDDLVKVDILVAGDRLEALSTMTHKERARTI